MQARRTTAPACLVCGQPARPPLAGAPADVPLCDDVNCRLVARQRHAMPPQAFAQYVALQAGMFRQRREAHEDLARAVAQQAEREAGENEVQWARVKGQLQDQLQGQLPPGTDRLVIPSGPRRLRKLGQRKRSRYRDHLVRIIAQAVSDAAPTPEPPAQELAAPANTRAALLANLCTLCRGGCCTDGGDTAYLTAATIRRFMAARPELQPHDVLAAYLALLQPRTEAGSCVNHGPTGCGLPREMRADLCNRYLCATAKGVQDSNPPAQAIVALVRRQDAWNRQVPGRDNRVIGVAVVTDVGITPVRDASN